jgi:ATP-binding cassette, subfamily B, bacterial
MLALLRFSFVVSPRAAALLVGTAVASAVAGVGMVALTGELVGQVSDLATDSSSIHSSDSINLIALMLACLFTMDGVMLVLSRMAGSRLVYASDIVLYRAISSTMVDSSRVEHLSSQNVLDEARRAQGIGNRAVWVGLLPLGELLKSRLLALGAAIVVAKTLSWGFAVLLYGAVVLVEVWTARMSSMNRGAWRQESRAAREAEYTYELALSGLAAKELRVFGYGQWMRERFDGDWWRATLTLWRVNARTTLRTALVYVALLGTLGGAVWFVTREANRGQIEVGVAATALAALLRLATSSNGVATAAVERACSALDALYRLPETARKAHCVQSESQVTGAVGGHAPRAPTRARLRLRSEPALKDPPRSIASAPSIELRDISFRYAESDRYVLRNLNLKLRAGEAVGLVGVNGAGKSTLVKILAGAIRPTEGHVLVDGVDIATLDEAAVAAWQRNLAPITQDFLRLPLTAAQNVCLAEPVDREELDRSAVHAALKEAVADLPLGWQTILDRAVVDGGDFSGGQWQRLALARALYSVHTGAGVLVLDEPAAALDVRSEAHLVDKYLKLTRGTTSLVISHRFSVVRNLDRICVLGEGELLEEGTHDQLIRSGGWYSEMFALQARNYQVDWQSDGGTHR